MATDLSLAPVALDPDEPVPLSLLLTEAITNAMKYVSADGGDTPRIEVTLSEDDDGHVRVTILNSSGDTSFGHDAAKDSTGLGSRLIDAFVSQLKGQLHIDETETAYVLRLDFVKLAARSTIRAAAQ